MYLPFLSLTLFSLLIAMLHLGAASKLYVHVRLFPREANKHECLQLTAACQYLLRNSTVSGSIGA